MQKLRERHTRHSTRACHNSIEIFTNTESIIQFSRPFRRPLGHLIINMTEYIHFAIALKYTTHISMRNYMKNVNVVISLS